MTLTGVNWASRPTMQLVSDIDNGPGPASTQESADAWRALSAGLTAADAEFTSAMKLAMGSWEGPAADAAQAALVPFSQWAAVADAMATRISAEAAINAEAFSATKAAMPSPPEVAAVAAVKDNPVDKVVGLLTGVPTPGEVAEGVTAAQQAEAAAAMAGYDVATSIFDDSHQTFQPAPILTTGVISAGTAPGAGARYGYFGGGSAQHYAATMSAGATGGGSPAGGPTTGGPTTGGPTAGGPTAGGPTAGASAGGGHFAGAGGTHVAAAGGSTADSGGGGLGGTAGGGSRSSGHHSTAVAAGLGAGGAGALGTGSARTFSASDALGPPAGGIDGATRAGHAGAGPGGGAPGAGVAGAGAARGAGNRRRGAAGGRGGADGLGGSRAAGLGGAGSADGGLSGSAATTAEGSVRGPLSAGGTSAVGTGGENLGSRGAGGGAGSASTGGRGGGGSGMGAGGGRGNRQDEDEHEIPDYLKDREHFSDGRVVAPAVIGADDEL